jgi:hypothetical protein
MGVTLVMREKALSKVYLATEAGGIPFLPFITMPYEI